MNERDFADVRTAITYRLFIVAVIAVTIILASLLFLSGCGGGPSVRQQPTTTVEAEGDVQVDQPTITEIARDLSAKMETVEGSVSQVGYKLDEQRRLLEETRLEKEQASQMSDGMLVAGVLLIALVAPNVFGALMTPAVMIVGVLLILGAKLLPLLLA